MSPFDPILHFWLVLSAICAKFEVSSFILPRDIRGSKIGSRDPYVTPFDLFFIFLLVLTAIHLGAKFKVSSFYRSGDIRRSQNSKNGSRDPNMIPLT